MSSPHHRPAPRRRIGGRNLPHVLVPPLQQVDLGWWRQILTICELRRMLRLSTLDVRQLLGDPTRDLSGYTAEQLRAVAAVLRARTADPRRLAITRPQFAHRRGK